MAVNNSHSLQVFLYLTVEKSAFYRKILEVFVTAKERYSLNFRTSEVFSLLSEAFPEKGDLAIRERQEEEEVDAALRQLCSWGNLVSHPDTTDVATLAEFYNPRNLYQITHEGESAEKAIRFFCFEPRFSKQVVGEKVYVCENPSVVAYAADHLRERSPPLICIEGQPKSTAHVLLKALRSAGIQILYHGDFDWEGLRIGNLMVKRYQCTPWLYTAKDYSNSPHRGKSLEGKVVQAIWDPKLATEMQNRNQCIDEESELEKLFRNF